MANIEIVRDLTSSGLLKLSDVGKIASSLRRGGLSVLPTETGYMLAALATNLGAVEEVFRVKGRDRSKPIHIACASLSMAERYGELNLPALRLLGELTPGPITVVVRQKPCLPDGLVTLNGTVGIRVPDCPLTIQVVEAVGAPVTATSVNEAGDVARLEDLQVLNQFDWPAGELVYAVEGYSFIKYSLASTLVRVTGEEVEILRKGPIGGKVISRVASRMGYLETAEWT